MARRTKEDALKTRDRILNEAAAIFDRHGMEGTTLAAVADAADVTRGAVYWHFKGKQALFDAVCEHTPLPLEMLPAEVGSEREADPLGRLKTLCLSALRKAAASPDALRTFAAPVDKEELLAPAAVLLMRHRRSLLHSKAYLTRVLHHAVKKGQLPARLDVDLASVALHGAMSGLLGEWLLAPRTVDLASRASRLLDAIFGAMRESPSLRLQDR